MSIVNLKIEQVKIFAISHKYGDGETFLVSSGFVLSKTLNYSLSIDYMKNYKHLCNK